MAITKKERIRRIKRALTPFLIFPLYCIYKLITKTLKYTEYGREELDALNQRGDISVISLWHDELFPLMALQKNLDIVTVVSPSVDGSFLADTLEKLGLRTVRGSSTRQGMKALLQAVKLMRDEKVHACVTLDGPLGPRHKAKEGALFLAHRSKAYVQPVRIIMHNHYTFNTWDKFQLPKPFSKVSVHFAKPYLIEAEELNQEVLEREKYKLEQTLEQLGGTDENSKTA